MAITIGINGFGRIGRVAFRIAINQPEKFKICGINVRNADLDYMIYMIRYDSIFGRFQGSLEKYEDGIVVNGEKIRVYSENDAADIPRGECGAEYIIDATGAYCTTEKAMAHIRGGAKKVIISAPAKDQDTPTFVMGVNHELYQSAMQVVSNASCTTNCLAPICKVLEDNYERLAYRSCCIRKSDPIFNRSCKSNLTCYSGVKGPHEWNFLSCTDFRCIHCGSECRVEDRNHL